MKMSLWGVSHMDYLDRQETFYRKIGNMEWIPVLLGFITPEPPRDLRRLKSLRGLSHEEVEQVFS